MKNLEIKITNQKLFDKKVNDLDYDFTNHLPLTGDVTINNVTYTGEHGYSDYKEEYGFIFKK